MKPVVVVCLALILSSCASAPEPVRQPGQSGQNGRSAPAGPSERDAFMATVFESQQKKWIFLSNHRELSVGVRNDTITLFVRAIVWNDGDATLGVDRLNGQSIGDYSVLLIHIGEGTVRTAGRDMNVNLNPWPSVPGIRLQRQTSPNTTTTLQEVRGASGSINYVSGPGGKLIRTDEYAVPLSELDLERGAAISVAFHAFSPVPMFATSSVAGLERGNYYATQIPVGQYLPIKLQRE
jgi:hypothetical protein